MNFRNAADHPDANADRSPIDCPSAKAFCAAAMTFDLGARRSAAPAIAEVGPASPAEAGGMRKSDIV